MLKACGIFEPCSPRRPIYSGKLIARAVELYLSGVELGYIRWHELQATLEKEFKSEFKQLGHDRPTPETVKAWVRKYRDAPEHLRDLGVQQVAPGQSAPWVPAPMYAYQLRPALPVPNASVIGWEINALLVHCMAFVAFAIMARCINSWIDD